MPTAASILPAADPHRWTPTRRARFLSMLEDFGAVRAASTVCGLSRQSVYKLRSRDPDFACDWMRRSPGFTDGRRVLEACVADLLRRAEARKIPQDIVNLSMSCQRVRAMLG